MDAKTSWSRSAAEQLKVFATAFVICSAGLSLTGDWLIIFTILKNKTKVFSEWNSQVFENILGHLFWSTVPALILYLAFCGFLQWKYYYRQRDRPKDWKCQPRKFLSWEDEKNEMFLGMLSLTIASFLSGLLSWHFENGGYNTIYFDISDYGWTYFILSFFIHFFFSDFLLYWAHRIFHMPLFYKLIHKYHHRYKQPTAFSFSAMHPIEMITYQSITLAPIFLIPIHWGELMFQVCYSFYYGILDHSGIKFESIWPWQPPSVVHDNHHQYFHCNFGFHLTLWDKLFGTMRRKDRVYNEQIFYGKGKSLDQATAQEIAEHESNIMDDYVNSLFNINFTTD